MSLAVSTGIQIAYVVGLVLLLFGPAVVAESKGHIAFYGWFWITGWIGMFRLARPESWWARHLYGPRKMERAEDRYEENPFT